MNVPGGIDSRVSPAGTRTPAPHERSRSGRPASRSARLPAGRSSSVLRAEPALEVAAAALQHAGARHLDARHALPDQLADADRAPPALGSRRPARERRAQDLQPEAGAAGGSRQHDGAVGRRPAAAASRARPSAAAPASGAAPARARAIRRSVRSVTGAGVVHDSHAVRPSSHEPTHGCAVPSNALDARKPGRPWKRPEDSSSGPGRRRRRRRPPRPQARDRVDLRVARAGRHRRPAVGEPAARGGRGEHALQAGLAVEPVAHEVGARRAAPRVAPERVVARRALEQVGQPGGAQVAPRQRLLGQHGRAQRLAHEQARDPDLADAAADRDRPCGARRAAIRTRSERTPRRRDPQVVEALPHRVRAPGDLDRGHLAAAVGVGHQVQRRDVARLVEADLDPVARLLQRAIGLPVRVGVAVEGGERAPLGELRIGGRGRRAQVRGAVVARHRLGVGAGARERVDDRGVRRERVVGGQRRPLVLGHPRGGLDAPAVGVGDHDLAAGRDAPQLVGRQVAGVGQQPDVRQRAHRGQAGEAAGRAVDHRRRLLALDAHERARVVAIPGAHPRQPPRRAERPGGARLLALARPTRGRGRRAGGRAPRPRRPPSPRRCGERSSSVPLTTVRAPSRSSSGPSWPGSARRCCTSASTVHSRSTERRSA